jgi:nitroreductase
MVGDMEFSDVVRGRRMIRRYDPDRPVPVEVVERCLANAVRAPSAGFSQGWDFVVLSTPAEREAFWTATTQPDEPDDPWLAGIRAAPVLILCLSHKDTYLDRYAAPDKGWTDRDESRWPVPYWDIDTGMAALLILLTATDQGLGSLFFGVPSGQHAEVHKAFGIPEGRTLIGVVSIGYAVQGPKSPSLRRHRRTGEEVAHWGRFGVAREDH